MNEDRNTYLPSAAIHPLSPFIGVRDEDPLQILASIKSKIPSDMKLETLALEVFERLKDPKTFKEEELQEVLNLIQRLKPKKISLLRFLSLFSHKKNTQLADYKAYNEQLGKSWGVTRTQLIETLSQLKQAQKTQFFQFTEGLNSSHPLYFKVEPTLSISDNLNRFRSRLESSLTQHPSLRASRLNTMPTSSPEQRNTYTNLGRQFVRDKNLENVIAAIGAEYSRTHPTKAKSAIGADVIIPELEKFIVLNMDNLDFLTALTFTPYLPKSSKAHESYYPAIIRGMLVSLLDPAEIFKAHKST